MTIEQKDVDFEKWLENEIARVSALIGQDLRLEQPFLTEVTRDAIRHFAWGIGDTNPLWTDEEYAKKTSWGGIIALPSIMWNFGLRNSIGFTGLHGLYPEDIWEYYLPVRVNDRITCAARLVDLVQKNSRLAGRSFEQTMEHTYKNQNGEIVAKYYIKVRRFVRADAMKAASTGKGKYSGLQKYHYTPDEIEKIEAGMDSEKIRGANPRYWQDVNEGDELGHVVKGPLTITDIMAFANGCGATPFIRAHRRGLDFRRRHPAAYVLTKYGIPDSIERVHWDDDFAREIGVPAAFDYGIQRVAWASNLLTNWMGDDSFIKRQHTYLREVNLVGDTLWYTGKVTRKFEENNEHLVDCEFLANDQRGRTVVSGQSIIKLPSKG